MAESIDPTDPTNDKGPLIPGNDDDDDGIDWNAPIDVGPEEPAKTPPVEPWAGGEKTSLPRELQGGMFDLGVTFQDSYAKRELEGEFPNMSLTELEFRTVKAPKSGGSVFEVKYHSRAKWYRLFTKTKGANEKTLNTNLPKEILEALGKSAEDQIRALQEQRDRNEAEIQVILQEKEQLAVDAQVLKEARQELEALKNQAMEYENKIHALEDKAGSFLDEATIQMLKDQKRALETEIQRKKRTVRSDSDKGKRSPSIADRNRGAQTCE